MLGPTKDRDQCGFQAYFQDNQFFFHDNKNSWMLESNQITNGNLQHIFENIIRYFYNAFICYSYCQCFSLKTETGQYFEGQLPLFLKSYQKTETLLFLIIQAVK